MIPFVKALAITAIIYITIRVAGKAIWGIWKRKSR